MAPRTSNASNQSKSSAKKKPIVHKKATNAKVKVSRSTAKKVAVAAAAAAAATVAKPLPTDWPVASKPPTISAKESALRPGSLLLDACNGRDIHINKQALMPPSLAKEKGRYLLIFPGNFSFKNVIKPSTNNTSANNNNNNSSENLNSTQDTPDIFTMDDSDENDDENDNNNEDDDDDDDANDNVSAPTAQASSNGATTASASASNNKPPPSLPQLGTVEGLSTDTPRFRIDFSGVVDEEPSSSLASKRSLVFPGTKVTTLSKYMWLNCSTRKKGSVDCKGIFSSAIVFGAPVWETVSPDGKVSQESATAVATQEEKKSSSAAPIDAAAAAQDDSSIDENERKPEWVHYGGSDRTIDGVYKGSIKKKKMVDNSSDPLASRIPIISKAPIFDDRGLPLRPAGAIQSPMVKTTKSVGAATTAAAAASALPAESDDDNDFGNDSDDEEFTASVPMSSVKARAAPKRQASAKKAKYAVDLLDSDVEEEEESSSSTRSDADEETDRAPKRAAAARRTSTATKTKRSKTKQTQVAKNTVDLAVESDDDADQSDSQNDKEPPKRTPSNGKRKSPKTTVSLLDEDSDDSSLGTEVKANNPKETKTKLATKITKKQPAASKSKKNTNFVLSSDGEDTFAMSDDEDIPASSINRQSLSRRAPRRSSAQKRPRYAEAKSDEDEDNATSNDSDKSDEDDTDNDSLSTAPLKLKAQTTKTTATKRARNTTKKTRASEQSKSVLELVSSDDSKEKPASNGSRKRKSVPNPNLTNKQQSDVSSHSGEETQRGAINVDDERVSAAEDKQPIKRQKKTAQTTTTRRRDSLESATKNTTEKGASISETPSPAVTASPFRSRRRKSPGSTATSAKKVTAKRNVFDLSKDEDFQF